MTQSSTWNSFTSLISWRRSLSNPNPHFYKLTSFFNILLLTYISILAVKLAQFLDPPKELRDKIYEACFKTVAGGNLVTPDANRSRRTTAGCDTSHTINAPVAILRICKQVHNEVREVLYKDKACFFDDKSHGKGYATFETDSRTNRNVTCRTTVFATCKLGSNKSIAVVGRENHYACSQ